jgi:hypothetical protein
VQPTKEAERVRTFKEFLFPFCDQKGIEGFFTKYGYQTDW